MTTGFRKVESGKDIWTAKASVDLIGISGLSRVDRLAKAFQTA